MTVLVILLILMIIGAIIAIEAPNLLSSIVCLGAIGFILSIAFLFLSAPDIAVTQIVVEILCLIILIRATISRDLTAVSGEREFFGMTVTIVILLVIAVLSIQMLTGFPEFGQPTVARIADAPAVTYLEQGHARTGASNIVTAILLDFRAYDTLGEATVLLCAVVGALAVLRRRAHKEIDEIDE
jgi:multisubunit Na+/H+ antiporter MnhB subunit